jgi:demethylmenaquinone methyltransferase/2-methoxy-6-polyprenyl-1,4-benzoquinol methylase
VGLDFSTGMIRAAERKARRESAPGLVFVAGDAAELPFADGSFDVVSCSHAMYELGPETRERVLSEAHRVLRHGGRFVMMEHCEPGRPLARFLYRVRLSAFGSSSNRDFARNEIPFLERVFDHLCLDLSPTGHSKVVSGVKGEHAAMAG